MAIVADLIAKRLYDQGCRHAFGIPGGEVLTIMDALARAGIAFHQCKHENAGGFMAEGTYHATGAPGIMVATIGPGAANLVNSVANALQDRVPLIVLTGCVPPAEAVTYTHQVIDHQAMLGPVTKASFQVPEGAAAEVIDKAVAIATEGQPGPVHLDIPIDVAGADVTGATILKHSAPEPTGPAPGPALDNARQLLMTAVRPVMIAGVDALNQGAAEDVCVFAKRYNIPLITTYKGKGIMPEGERLSLGAAGLSPKADDLLLPFIQSADLVILAGYDPIEMRAGWRNPWGENSKVIEFATTPNRHYMHQADFSFVCDTRAGLRSLGENIPGKETWPDGEIAAIKTALAEAFPRDEAWGPAAVIDEARKTFPKNGVATVDTGAHRILLSQIWQCSAPRTLLQSTAFCTMGVALPLAIGHRIADPNTPVIAFTGDAGLEMVMGELATLRDLKIPVIIVVFVDKSLALIELKQRAMGFDNLGVDFGNTDFPALAQAMGGTGVEATTREQLSAEIKTGLNRAGYTLIACPIGERPYDGRF
jgi:acetolactate synthase I/II/III large subunit